MKAVYTRVHPFSACVFVLHSRVPTCTISLSFALFLFAELTRELAFSASHQRRSFLLASGIEDQKKMLSVNG